MRDFIDSIFDYQEFLLNLKVKFILPFLVHVPNIIVALLVFVLFTLVARGARRGARSVALRVTDDKSLESLAGTMGYVLAISGGALVAATILFPSLGVKDLVGVLGLTSVAIGFAFKDIFQNFLSGIILLTQRPFKIGDQISAGPSQEGTVEDITIRSTSILTYDGQRILIPNSTLLTDAVTVRTAFEKRRSSFSTGIGYGEDIEEARTVILESLEGCNVVLQDPAPRVFVTEHGDSAIGLEVVYWTNSNKSHVVEGGDQVATAIKYALDRAEIEIPFPQRVVHTNVE